MGRLHKLSGTVVVLVATLAMTAAPALAAAPLEELSASVKPAVGYVETTFTGFVYDPKNYGEPEDYGYIREAPFTVTLRCTGFVVNPDGYIITAGHCIEYDAEIRAAIFEQVARWELANVWEEGTTFAWAFNYASENYRIDGADRTGRPDVQTDVAFGIAVSGVETGESYSARVLGLRGFDKGDVALLKIEAEDLPSLLLAPEAEIGVGTEVVSVGYSADVDLVTDPTFDPSFLDGTVSAERTIDGNLFKVYEITANVRGGMSGGPTVDTEGRVVGLNSFGIAGADAGPKYIRPASIIQEMLDDEGVTNEQGEVHQAYLAGLAALFAGDKAAALENFDHVLDLVPSHELAITYRAEAVRLPDPVVEQTPEGGSGLLLVIGGAVALVLVGGLGFAVARSRGPKTPVPATPVVASPVVPAPVVSSVATTEVDLAAMVTDLPPAPVATIDNGHRACGGCGEPLALGARFCPSCGTPAVQRQDA
jgi:S1-C subfamily serine protease